MTFKEYRLEAIKCIPHSGYNITERDIAINASFVRHIHKNNIMPTSVPLYVDYFKKHKDIRLTYHCGSRSNCINSNPWCSTNCHKYKKDK